MKTKSKELKVKILLLITGSIAAVRIPLLASQLVKNNYEIKCVLSENAEKLIQPLSLSILSRNTCILDKDQWSYHHSRPLHSFYEEGTFELLKRLKEENIATLLNLFKNWALIRTFSIIGYKLPSDYIHLLEKEQFDEN